MRRYLPLLGLVLALAAPVAAHADTISTYDIAFVSSIGGAGGTGTLTVDTKGSGTTATPDGSYTANPFSTKQITALSFTLDGDTFHLNPFTNVSFDHGLLTGIDYNGLQLDGSFFEFQFDLLDLDNLSYEFFDNAHLEDRGTTSVVPEPSSLALLGTGLLGLAGVVRRKLMV